MSAAGGVVGAGVLAGPAASVAGGAWTPGPAAALERTEGVGPDAAAAERTGSEAGAGGRPEAAAPRPDERAGSSSSAAAARVLVLGASVQGRAHARLGRNNQDGWALAQGRGRVAAVVTDGCGSQPRSEVGAALGAQFLARWLAREPLSSELPERATEALAGFVARVAGELGGEAGALEAHFLFTFLALVREGRTVSIFGVGDGGVWVDERWLRLDPGPDNAPEYLAYRLGGGARPPARQHFLGEARVAAVMTDGLVELAPARLEALLEGATGWRNPLTLQRRLNVLHAQAPLLDDATLAVVAGGG